MGMDVYGKNPDTYFRANVWSWRPIVDLTDIFLDAIKGSRYEDRFKINTEDWHYNDGAGLDNQDQCNLLARGLEAIIKKKGWHDDDTIYAVRGRWDKIGGGQIHHNTEAMLNRKFPLGTIMCNAYVHKNGNIYYPSYGIEVSHLKEFISFLENCEGFNIM